MIAYWTLLIGISPLGFDYKVEHIISKYVQCVFTIPFRIFRLYNCKINKVKYSNRVGATYKLDVLTRVEQRD
jgi:hypothetical protein